MADGGDDRRPATVGRQGDGAAAPDPAAVAAYRFDRQIGHLLRRAYQRHLAIFQAHAGDRDLTSVQFATLCALRDNGPQSQGALVRNTGVDQATIRGIVGRLRARGLIELARDRRDARKVIIAITAAGEALLDRVIPRAIAISELTLGPLNDAERLAVMMTLHKLAEGDDGGRQG